jgi:HK97 gp10 family phage protein
MAKTPPPLQIEDKAFLTTLQKIESEARTKAGRKALERVGKSVMKASMKNTPVEFGDMRDSHRLSITIDDEQVHADIDVKDEAAWYVHEQLEAQHDDGQAKFLQKAIKSRKGFFQKAIRTEFSALLRKRGLAE